MKIKFLTLNLLWGGELAENILSFIKSEKPDICVFQEAIEDSKLIRKINAVNGLAHSNFFPLLKKSDTDQDIGLLTLARWPLKDERRVLFANKYMSRTRDEIDNDPTQIARGLLLSSLQNGEEKVTIGNVHGMWDHHGNDTPIRLQMGQSIISELKNKKKAAVAGDFNMFPNTQTINSLERHMINVFKDELTSTFNVSRKSVPGNWSKSVVDMIFASSDIKVTNHYQPQVDVSDHLPLVAEFEV